MNRKEKLEVRSSKFENGSPVSASKSSPFDFPIYNLRVNTRHAFTLLELLVSMGVLALLVLLFARLLSSAASITTLGHKRMDTDSQARQLLDRVAVDFAQMVKRTDVSYYLKAGGNNMTDPSGTTGINDRMAFFSTVTGYYPTSSNQSPLSLVAYRINSDSTSSSYNKMERMGKGLIWDGVSSSYIPIVFLNPPSYNNGQTINSLWNSATVSGTADTDYERVGPQVLRFEYYYLLSYVPAAGGLLRAFPPNWTSVAPINVSANIKDVAAIVVAIAVLDPRSKVLLTDSQIATLAGRLVDFDYSNAGGWVPGQLLSTWQTALNSIMDPNSPNFDQTMPRQAIQGVRLYERYFYLPPTSP